MNELLVARVTAAEFMNLYRAPRRTDALDRLVSGADVEMTAIQVMEPTDVGAAPATMFVWAAERITLGDLDELARTRPVAYNEHAADLSSAQTYLSWKTSTHEARVDTWSLPPHATRALTAGVFLCAFASADWVLVTTHVLTDEELDAFVCDLQACAHATGPNWSKGRARLASLADEPEHH